jgi:hypothetical protein
VGVTGVSDTRRMEQVISSTDFSLCGGDCVANPISCFCKPVFVRRRIDVTLVLKYSRLSGQPHKLDSRNGIIQDDAGTLHSTAAIHGLTLDHDSLGIDGK